MSWYRAVLSMSIAAAAACGAEKRPVSTPFPNQQLVDEIKEFQKAHGFQDTKNFASLADDPKAIYRCYFTGKWILPDSYRQLRLVHGTASGCGLDEQKYDIFFYPAEAIASGSVPVTPALAEASVERLLVVVPHEDTHDQKVVRRAPPELSEAAATLIGFLTAAEFAKGKYGPAAAISIRLEGEARLFLAKAKIVNACWDRVSALYRSVREGRISDPKARVEKQRLFAELQLQCEAVRPDPVSFNKCPAAMNNAGLAFDRTYTREYPRVFDRYQSLSGDRQLSIEQLKALVTRIR
jgi:hypothetical protein